MHEFSLARNMLEIVIDAAEQHELSSVSEVRVDIGEAAGIHIEALSFAWEYLRTTCDRTGSALLQVHHIESAGTCSSCNYSGRAAEFAVLCPECGKGGFRLSAGTEFTVTGISGE